MVCLKREKLPNFLTSPVLKLGNLEPHWSGDKQRIYKFWVNDCKGVVQLLEVNVTHSGEPHSASRELVPFRVKRLNPFMDWKKSWRAASLPILSSKLSSFLWKTRLISIVSKSIKLLLRLRFCLHYLNLNLPLPWSLLDLAFTLAWLCLYPPLTLCQPCLDHTLTLPSPCLYHPLTFPWPCFDLFLTLCWPCIDLAFTLAWP